MDAPTPFTVSYDHRHDLRAGRLSEGLQHAFADNGIALSENTTIEKKKHGGWVIADGEHTYHLTRINVVDELALDHRKRLNKGVITDELRNDLKGLNIHLSANATAQKDGRREWLISDGNQTYRIREHEKKVDDPATGKRITASRKLHVYADKRHNYTTKEDVRETWIAAAPAADQWVHDLEAKGHAVTPAERQRLWNWGEASDVATDSKTAQRLQMSFTRGLSYEQNKALLREYVAKQFTQKGFIADVAIHDKEASDGLPNQHAHVLVFTRHVMATGTLAARKSGYFDPKIRVDEWREAWAAKQNTALEAAGSDMRVDHRSYAARGLDIVAGEHLGPSDWNRDCRGDVTEKGQQNAAIEAENQRRDKQIAAIGRRVRDPDYSAAAITAYYERQAVQENRIGEPDPKTREAQIERIKAAERLEQAKVRAGQQLSAATTSHTAWYGLGSKTSTTDLTKIAPGRRQADPAPYAGQETQVGWFGLGSKITTTYRPGDANRPRHEREQLAREHQALLGSRGEQWERFNRAQAYHERTLGGLLGDNASGSSTQDVRERMGRVRAWAAQHIERLQTRWRARSEGRGRDHEPER